MGEDVSVHKEGIGTLIADWVQEHGHHLESEGENPQIILISESHEDQEMLSAQVKLIRTLCPDLILHEWLGAYEYNPENDSFGYSDLVEYNEMDEEFLDDTTDDFLRAYRPIYEEVKKRSIKVVGCDASHQEWADELERISKETGHDIGDLLADPELDPVGTEGMKFRESVMVRRIVKSLENLSDAGCVVAIVGRDHGLGIIRDMSEELERVGGYYFVNQVME